MRLLLWIASVSLAFPLGAAPMAARINGKPVLESDVDAWMAQEKAKGKNVSRAEALDHLILYRLSLAEAQRRKVDKKPEVKEAVDKALYRGLLEQLKADAGGSFQPTPMEMKELYAESPLVRVRHLVLMADTDEAAQVAKVKIGIIQRELADGTDFKDVVLKHSEDPNVHLNGGDLDFRGRDALEDPFYSIALALKPKEISAPIQHSGGIHILQLLDRKPFESAFAPYLAYLGDRFRDEKERSVLESALKSLKRKAKIEVFGATATP